MRLTICHVFQHILLVRYVVEFGYFLHKPWWLILPKKTYKITYTNLNMFTIPCSIQTVDFKSSANPPCLSNNVPVRLV